MKMKQWVLPGFILVVAVFFSSCVTIHPNEKLIVGEWKPVKVEKFFTPEEEEQLKNAQSQSTGTRPPAEVEKPAAATGNTSFSTTPPPPTPDQGRGGERAGGRNPEAELNKRMQVESRSNMMIFRDKTLEKFYREKTVEGTWKLKGKGSVLVIKVPERREIYRVDIIKIAEDSLVVVGTLPIGGIKITYEKIGDALRDEARYN